MVLPFVLDTGAALVLLPADVFRTLTRTGTVTSADFIGTGTAVDRSFDRFGQLRIESSVDNAQSKLAVNGDVGASVENGIAGVGLNRTS